MLSREQQADGEAPNHNSKGPSEVDRMAKRCLSGTMVELLVGRHEVCHVSHFPSMTGEPGLCP